ncbi:DUF1223 domain-containing protein [Ancylobacter crimeensis]|nr:DUF1223 domain-containing protein [Ancylobacter crimeensis]
MFVGMLASVLAPFAAWADSTAPATPTGPGATSAIPVAVVELYTSQGCSSCPPADTLLGALAATPGYVPLTLAVDYWDYLGWKDTLAKHGHSVRQKAYARMRGDGKMFTPQVVINGQMMTVGNDKPALDAALAKAPPLTVPVSVMQSDNDRLAITIGNGLGAGEVWLCPVSRSETVKIGRGENEGTTVDYHNVVRGWFKLGDWTGGKARFTARLDELRGEDVDAVAVLVQSGTAVAPGPILGAALMPISR